MKLHPHQCQLCNELFPPHEIYCYWDEARGLNAALVCPLCLVEHIEKYYGKNRGTQSIRENHNLPEL